MPHWYAKVRRRLKYVHAITISSAPDGGAHSFLMFSHAGDYVPTGRTWHESVEDAKKIAENDFQIKPSDWIEEAGLPAFATKMEELAAEALTKYAAAVTEQPPIDYVKIEELRNRHITPAEGRRFKKLLPGTWLWEDHEFKISSDGTWQLNCSDEIRLPQFTYLRAKEGTWAYGCGCVSFRYPTSKHGHASRGVYILELDDDIFTFHADPEPITLKRSGSN